LHVQPLSINIRNHRRRCRDDGKGHDCKSKSDEFQAVSVRHLVHLKTVIHQLAISHVGISQASNDADRPRQHPCARLSARSKPDQQQPSAEIPHPFLNSQKFRSFIQFDLNVKVAIFSRYQFAAFRFECHLFVITQ
jgi:hypothetical protein